MTILYKGEVDHVYDGQTAGGHFFGCVPDGKAVMQTLQPTFPSYKGPLLQILAEWKGTPQPFGSAYSMAIGDTVTQGVTPSYHTPILLHTSQCLHPCMHPFFLARASSDQQPEGAD